MQKVGSQKDITIRDLAAQLDLSTATVSRALNDDGSVRGNTKKRVFELAERLGYRSNDNARMLRSRRSNTIGCIVPRFDNYLLSTMISVMEEVARHENYSLVVMQSHGLKAAEACCANVLFNKRVDGLVVAMSQETGELAHFRSFIQKNIPVVLLDHACDSKGVISISADNYKAGYEMTRHLLAQGRRHIVHITSDSRLPVYLDRCAGYRQALAEASIPVDERNIIWGGVDREDGIRVAGAVAQWKQRPDAIFAVSDMCAVGCITALGARGISVPEDIAVAGFDDDPVSLATHPGLTTVRYPASQMGAAAVRRLIQYLRATGSDKPVQPLILPGELLVRGSTVIV